MDLNENGETIIHIPEDILVHNLTLMSLLRRIYRRGHNTN